ncbi:MAG: 50S ribosomal protein L15 [Myxococcales bacterium]|nr:50S ribosomal protein L15 [Myxococcales bacterium]
MGTTLETLSPPAGARKRKKRIGRGIGSHRGKTSGKGMKGQLYRHRAMPAWFEGGQLPLHMRLPKRGFINIHRVEVHGINVGLLEGKFEAGTEITPELLHERGLVPKKANVIKLLGTGELSTALTIRLHRASASAQAKVEAAGGTLQLLSEPSADAGEG